MARYVGKGGAHVNLPAVRGPEERNRMAVENHKLIHFVVGKFFRRHRHARRFYTRDDAYADGFIGLLRACELYDESREIAFSTYAVAWIRQGIQNGYRRHGIFYYSPPTFPAHDVRLVGDSHPFRFVSVDPERHHDNHDDLHKGILKLPKREARVILMMLQGQDRTQIAGELGVTREWVRKIEEVAKRRLYVYLTKDSRKGEK